MLSKEGEYLNSVVNLPDYLKEEDLAIKLNVRKLESGEGPVCYNFEMPVLLGPVVYVVKAEEK
ncbi:MAG: hypothetical protein JW894_14345 [Bacteroidales bacterium]|nr:hypothetical protein [Bacteroidales bacterium]